MDFLEEYVIKHFTDEEDIQKEYNYPKAKEQCAQHEYFKSELKNLRKNLENKGETAILALNIQWKLVNWIKEHIINLDKDLGKFLIQNTKK